MRAALVRNGVVENIVIVSSLDFDFGDGSLVVPIGDEPVQIGATWDGQTFTNPPEPEPEPEPAPEPTKRDQLIAAGFTEAQADAILALD